MHKSEFIKTFRRYQDIQGKKQNESEVIKIYQKISKCVKIYQNKSKHILFTAANLIELPYSMFLYPSSELLKIDIDDLSIPS